MTKRRATCRCGQLSITCRGEPVRVSVCHCLDCQQRAGSAFAAQARFPATSVRIEGAFKPWTTVGDTGRVMTFNFCPTCGSTVFFQGEGQDTIAAAVGAFADPNFPAPGFSVWEERKHAWVAILGDDVERI